MAEEFAPFVEEDVFFILTVVFGVQFLGLGGFFFGNFVLVLLEGEEGTTHAGQGIEHAEVLGGVGFEGFFVGTGSELVELFGELRDGELEAGQGEGRSIVFTGGFEQVRLGLGEESEAFAVAEFVLVAAVEPVMDVGGIKGDASFSEFMGDGVIGGAIVEEVVDEVALFFGQAGDFTVAAGIGVAVLEQWGDRWRWGFRYGDDGEGLGGGDVHGRLKMV